MEKLNALANIVVSLSRQVEVVIALIAIVTFIYAVLKYREISKIENEINQLENEYDFIPEKSKNPYLNNEQLKKVILQKREPIVRKIERLKQKRRFILDKIPLVGLLKK